MRTGRMPQIPETTLEQRAARPAWSEKNTKKAHRVTASLCWMCARARAPFLMLLHDSCHLPARILSLRSVAWPPCALDATAV